MTAGSRVVVGPASQVKPSALIGWSAPPRVAERSSEGDVVAELGEAYGAGHAAEAATDDDDPQGAHSEAAIGSFFFHLRQPRRTSLAMK